MTPGDGDVPFEHLFAWIEERGYAGGVTLEVLPPEGVSPDEVAVEIERGRDHIRRVLAARASNG